MQQHIIYILYTLYPILLEAKLDDVTLISLIVEEPKITRGYVPFPLITISA